jgi:hypothetical protein
MVPGGQFMAENDNSWGKQQVLQEGRQAQEN